MSDDDDPTPYIEAKARAARWHAATVDGKHHVFVVHPTTPQWWRLVATFGRFQLAEDYADFQNMFTADKLVEAENGCGPALEHEDLPAPADLPETPASAVRVEYFRRPTPAEAARVGAALIEDATAAAGRPPQIEAAPVSPAPVPQTEIAPTDAPSGPAREPPQVAAAPAPSQEPPKPDAPAGTAAPEAADGKFAVISPAEFGGIGRRNSSRPRFRHSAGDYPGIIRPEAGDRTLTPNEEKVGRVLAAMADGARLTWKELATRSGIPYGSVTLAVQGIERKGTIPGGRKWLALETIPPKRGANTGFLTPGAAPPPKPARPSEDAEIAAFLAQKGATKPPELLDPFVGDVMNEVRRDGPECLPEDDKFRLFRIDGIKEPLDREALVARANRLRIMRGAPVWDYRKVKWQRQPEPEAKPISPTLNLTPAQKIIKNVEERKRGVQL